MVGIVASRPKMALTWLCFVQGHCWIGFRVKSFLFLFVMCFLNFMATAAGFLRVVGTEAESCFGSLSLLSWSLRLRLRLLLMLLTRLGREGLI